MCVGQYVYCDCCNKKCVFCVLWIMCINVVVCQYDMIYSVFINGLKKVLIEFDCKVLVDMVVFDKVVFVVIVKQVKVVVVV